MTFQASLYGEAVAQILALDGDGYRPMPLVCSGCVPAARGAITAKRAADLFPLASAPEAALSGLWLYFGCFDECHTVCQDLASAEGSYWHAILHRQEPDAGNSGYWFRRVGRHPVYEPLAETARQIAATEPAAGFTVSETWDPFRFVDFYESARRTPPDAPAHRAARAVQLAEWQLLFDYCARPRS
ncbi:MAG TPA: hypothetical protein VMJ34_03345 [Bryobacteraceae bacterium]|nr:hypothetical protein [Bryobacteraceae bacterium]